MTLRLPAEEPEAGPWRVELLSTVVNAVTRRGPSRGRSGRPAVLAVDGRSNNGKTTLAERIRELVPGAAVVHTDDIAWEHSCFGDLDTDAIDLANMPPDGSPPDHDGWTAEEISFNMAQRTWERADIIVCGTPEIRWNPVTQIVIAPPLGPAV